MIDFPKTRAMTRSELAQAYMPNVTCKSALRTLNRWICRNRLLLKDLNETGYTHNQRILTPKQVQIIYKYLNPP